MLVSEASGVVSEYVARAHRPDLQARTLSAQGLPVRAPETWVFVQDGRIYFENAPVIEQLRARLRPWREIHIAGAVAVQVFRFPDGGAPAREPADHASPGLLRRPAPADLYYGPSPFGAAPGAAVPRPRADGAGRAAGR